MSKLRSVNTHFWSDNYVIDLDPTEKLLFLYLLTNESTNMLGIYELHLRKMAFETGIDKGMIEKIFDRFHRDGKASYVEGHVCLHNFTKHQSYNANMKKSAISTFNELPPTVRKQGFIEPLLKGLEPLPKGSEPIAKVESEYESIVSDADASDERIKISEDKKLLKLMPNADRIDYKGKALSVYKQLPESATYTAEAVELAFLLLDCIVGWDSDHRYAHNPPSMSRWVADIEKAMRIDGQSYKRLRGVIEYTFKRNTQRTRFWAPNIQSGEKLREHCSRLVNEYKQEYKKITAKDHDMVGRTRSDGNDGLPY